MTPDPQPPAPTMKIPTAAEINADALLAEVEAVIASGDAVDRRTDRLLRQGSVSARMADLALQMEQGQQELDAIDAEQIRIEAQIRALEAG